MATLLALGEFDRLATDGKIRLVQELWDRIADENLGPTAAQRSELQRRLHAIDSREDRSTPWAIVRERVRSRR